MSDAVRLGLVFVGVALVASFFLPWLDGGITGLNLLQAFHESGWLQLFVGTIPIAGIVLFLAGVQDRPWMVWLGIFVGLAYPLVILALFLVGFFAVTASGLWLAQLAGLAAILLLIRYYRRRA